ncbi:MAG TPA: hypothetical protein GXX49_04610 [Clostridiaceae bacterium]|nr:hypothetical protein [Clostridiaceae bacterium]
MHANLKQSFKKIAMELSKLGSPSKKIIKIGTWLFLGLLTIGALLKVLNHTVFGYDWYYEHLSISIIKTSFTMFAEAVIGGILIDFFLKRL